MSKDRFSHKKAQNSQNLFEILCLFVANKPLRHQHDLSVGARFHHELMRARSLRKWQLMADDRAKRAVFQTRNRPRESSRELRPPEPSRRVD